jgi:hypothetical protein
VYGIDEIRFNLTRSIFGLLNGNPLGVVVNKSTLANTNGIVKENKDYGS